MLMVDRSSSPVQMFIEACEPQYSACLFWSGGAWIGHADDQALLARLRPIAEAQRQRFVAHGPVQGTLAYHWARMIEMLHAMEVIAELLQDEALLAGPLTAPLPAERPTHRSGVGVIEAPRGTLIHHYEIGDDDLIRWCNLIVSTTHNNHAMNASVRAVAQEYFDGRSITEGLLNRMEVAVRAYDPCLSCATHALGSMPLQVQLVDAAGQVRDSVLRHGDGRIERKDSRT